MTNLLAWNLDEASGPVIDYSGNNRGFTIAAPGVRIASGKDAGGLTLATGNGAFTGPALTGLQTASRTVIADIKNTANVTGHVLEMYVTGIGSSAWSILYLNNNLQIQARNSSTVVRPAVPRLTDNLWHQIAGTYDGTNVRLWVDGVNVATAALAGPMRTDADTFYVLDQTDTSTTIDNVRLFDTALTQAQIQAFMNVPVSATATPTKVYFSNGQQASAIYEMTAGGLVQRNSFIIK